MAAALLALMRAVLRWLALLVCPRLSVGCCAWARPLMPDRPMAATKAARTAVLRVIFNLKITQMHPFATDGKYDAGLDLAQH